MTRITARAHLFFLGLLDRLTEARGRPDAGASEIVTVAIIASIVAALALAVGAAIVAYVNGKMAIFS